MTLADGRGRVGRGRIVLSNGPHVDVEIESQTTVDAPTPAVTVWQALPKGHKLDSIVQQLAELGVGRLGVFSSERSVPRWQPARVTKAIDRLKAIARASGKQSHRSHWLVVEHIGGVDQVAARMTAGGISIALHAEASKALRDALPDSASSVSLVVGPEGGLAPSEIDLLTAVGATTASLGAGILRTEHAGAIAAAIVLFRYGAIG